MSVFKLYAKKVQGKTGLFYLYLYKFITQENKPELSILKNPNTNETIKIPEKYLIPSLKNFQKISNQLPKNHLAGFESVIKLNEYIQESYQKFITINGDKRFISNSSKTIDDYIDKIIERQKNEGTRLTYINLKNTFLQFNLVQSEGRSSKLLFSNLTTQTLNLFHKWLINEPKENEKIIINTYLLKNGIVGKLRARERNTNNSANDKLKRLKAVINSAHNEGYYFYHLNPFKAYKASEDPTKIEILSLEDLKKVITTKYKEVLRRTAKTKDGASLWGKEINKGKYQVDTIQERNQINKRYVAKHYLVDIRNYWLFQLFSQGIRVSDLITLRWWDFSLKKELRIEKSMVKTRELISIMVNDKMTDIISKYLYRYNDFLADELQKLDQINIELDELISDSSTSFYAQMDAEDESYKFCSTCIDGINIRINYISRRYIPSLELNEIGLEIIIKNYYDQLERQRVRNDKRNIKMILRPSYQDPWRDNIRKWFINSKLNYQNKIQPKINNLKQAKHKLVCDMIVLLSGNNERKKQFVFTLLNNDDFTNIGPKDSFGNINEDQYRKFQSARTYYNKNLKLISIQADIKCKLTTHLARHSYTSLMLELGENINLFDLMTSLGHKHLSTTQGYIRRFSNDKIDKLNQVISNEMDKEIISI